MAKGKYERWLTAEGLGLVEAWCREGYNDEELSRAMGISASTLYRWMNDHREIWEATTRGRAGAREQILNSMYKKATGFSVFVKVPMRVRAAGGEDRIVTVEKEEYYPPDDRAARIWLNADERRRLRDEETGDEAERDSVTVVVDL